MMCSDSAIAAVSLVCAMLYIKFYVQIGDLMCIFYIISQQYIAFYV